MALRRGVLLVTLVPVLLGGGAVAAPAGQTGPARLPYFGDDAFAGVWTRTDALVADATVARSWVWGPQQISGPLEERYDGLPGNKHLVQYFDKSRMEINDPGADRNASWYVTNGLLTVELISGRLRTGLAPNAYENRGPAQIPVAGDTDDPNAPTYASFRGVSSTSGDNEHPAPDRTGADVTAIINRAGQVSEDPTRALPATRIAAFVPESAHNVPAVFWDTLHASGSVQLGGSTTTAPLWDPWYFATGLPISEPYWAQVRITEAAPGGPQAVTHWVLIQAFERRVLTYIPDYSPPWDVQMGNIGQHYVTWRYPDGLPGQAVVYNPASAGVVCRARAPSGALCDPVDAVGPPPTAAYYDDILRADAAGTLNAATLAAKFRLLPGAAIRLKNAADLNPVERFFLQSGQALFDHRNGAGEIEIDSGNTSIRPIDTQFTVARDAAGEIKLAVIVGDGGVEVRSPTGVTTITAGSQVRVAPSGAAEFAEPLDAISQQAWSTFAAQNNVDSPVTGFDLTQCGAASSAFLPPAGDKRLGCAAGDAAFLGPDAPGQVVLFGGGLLLFDPLDQSPTVYALYHRDQAEGGRTWEAFALTDSEPTAFLKLHPTAAQRLGDRQQTCPTAPWAIQPFAGGAAIALPDTSTCDTISHTGAALYLDGTWAPFDAQGLP